MHHAFKTYSSTALIVPLMLLPLLAFSPGLVSTHETLDRHALRTAYLFLWLSSKSWKHLIFSQVGTKNLSNISRNRYWVVPCKTKHPQKQKQKQNEINFPSNVPTSRPHHGPPPIPHHNSPKHPLHRHRHPQIAPRRTLPVAPPPRPRTPPEPPRPHAHALLPLRKPRTANNPDNPHLLRNPELPTSELVHPHRRHPAPGRDRLRHRDARNVYAFSAEREGEERVFGSG